MNKNTDKLREFSILVRSDNGQLFRDLNKNGKLDVYEDPHQPIEARVNDLENQMTLEEKAGLLFINGTIVNPDGSIDDPSKTGKAEIFPGVPALVAKTQMEDYQMNHFNIWSIPSAKALSTWSNKIQQYAEETRLGIPITIASDPRNHFSSAIFEMQAKDFSQWCQHLGLGAIGDSDLIKQFADVARKEYLATGIRLALHPQVDLATEPRWPRIGGTFGADAHLSSKLVAAYIEGFQGKSLGFESVACMTKHFPGGGPQKEGLDPHFEFQKGQIYPGNNFNYHLLPFEAAIAANTAAIMPYYGIPIDQTDENVAMSFNKTIITSLLREKYHYDGVVCTDWGLITDLVTPDFKWPARAWGVEHLSEIDRVKKALDAGVDQFGGESCPQYVVELVREGLISEHRLNQSVRRLLRLKFQLGLFDQPFVDPELFTEVFGNPESADAGMQSQSRAMTLLKNNGNFLPLPSSHKIYVKNIDLSVARDFAQVVSTPEEADIAILHLSTPWYPVEAANPMSRDFHHGDLDFKGEDKAEIMKLLNSIPTIVVISMDRPAVIPEINARAAALLADFGASDEAVLNVIFGQVEPQGKLPFELPSSMEAVRKQRSDVPSDSEHPLYPSGFGLSYGD